MQKFSIIVFLLMSFSHVNGQIGKNNQLFSLMAPFQKELIGRVNFPGILDAYDRNISLGAEYQFNPQWSAGIDAGYIFQSEYIKNNKGTRGMLLRPFMRYYFKEKRTGYLEAHLHYKTVAYKVKDWIGRDFTNGIPAYEELSTFDFNKKVFGISVIIGDKFNMSKDNQTLKLEPYIGLGARFKKQEAENGSFTPSNNWLIPETDPEFTYLAILMGMRLTFKL